MPRKKVFKTAEEAVEYLFSEELESEMFVLPPEVDEFTDEEGFDDSETLDPSIRDVICPIISDIIVQSQAFLSLQSYSKNKKQIFSAFCIFLKRFISTRLSRLEFSHQSEALRTELSPGR
ncbi:hypothetical protein NPIL_613921 [Nephila pilipes]|uniref:Uncharacterized protein n=1 Tax=Nephila pilipes TaxID=299642 RepID=A0A8X6PXN4_NEPPI|nr:hypothetical protein NPIL_613921 [Nephila pilipes]